MSFLCPRFNKTTCVRLVRQALPPLDFITLHYTYFITSILICSLIFWGVSDAEQPVSYVDSLFMVVSAMTETGLNTVNLSQLNTFQQILLFVLIIFGSTIFISWFIVLFRKRAFEIRFKEMVVKYKAEKAGRHQRRRSSAAVEEARQRNSIFAYLSPLDEGASANIPAPQRSSTTVRFASPINEILSRAVVGRNSSIHGLTYEDRLELGGAEYRAARLLAYLIPAYFLCWQILGCMGAALYISFRTADVAAANAINPWWLGIFLGVSSFNNCGLSLLDGGMGPFAKMTYLLLTFTIMILAGNTAFPLFLRLSIWLMHLLLPRSEDYKHWRTTCKFILDHPRRVYTNLFPAAHTWWLSFVLLILTSGDWIAFELLNLNNPVVATIPAPFREVIGLFQAVSIRTPGFSIIPVSSLAVGNQMLCVIMMYISIYPVVITLRSSNVYEDQSLGIFGPEGKAVDEFSTKEANSSPMAVSNPAVPRRRWFFLQQQLRNQLAHDLWWLAISILLIICIETNNYNEDPQTFSLFNIIFEVVSAYGPVGLSTGLPDASYALSGRFHITSKLILCAVMIRGRHRGLPVAIDKAVILPKEDADKMESQQVERIQHIVLGGPVGSNPVEIRVNEVVG